MKIGGFGELENLRKSISRDDAAKGSRQPNPKEAQGAGKPDDKVQVSSEARMIGKLAHVPDMRMERVATIKDAVEKGDYLTPERLHSGIRKMMRDL